MRTVAAAEAGGAEVCAAVLLCTAGGGRGVPGGRRAVAAVAHAGSPRGVGPAGTCLRGSLLRLDMQQSALGGACARLGGRLPRDAGPPGAETPAAPCTEWCGGAGCRPVQKVFTTTRPGGWCRCAPVDGAAGSARPEAGAARHIVSRRAPAPPARAPPAGGRSAHGRMAPRTPTFAAGPRTVWRRRTRRARVPPPCPAV